MDRWLSLLAGCCFATCAPGCLPSPEEDTTLGAVPESTAVDEDVCVNELVPTERPVSMLDADPATRASQAFPNWSSACAGCIQSECAAQLAGCVGEAGCVEFAACHWYDEEPSPANELRCARELGQNGEDPDSAIRALGNCWQRSCVEACQLGTYWSCIGEYSLPAPEGDVAQVTQVLHQLLDERPVSGVSVRFCGSATPAEDCASSIVAEGTSDADGLARVELPLATDDRQGWSGYRHVVGEQYGVRLQSNLAITRDRFMLQHVPTLTDAARLRPIFGGDEANGNIVFQVFDCARTGAERVELEVTRADNDEPVGGATRVQYQVDASGFRLGPGGTRSVGDGGGAILDLPPGEWVWVRARRQCGGDVVAQVRVRTVPGELLLLELHPDGGG
jgi:hypothetical protein